jgi:6-pyruvoyltetrahydropterin/6-carboxytetrahydropterin synthase
MSNQWLCVRDVQVGPLGRGTIVTAHTISPDSNRVQVIDNDKEILGTTSRKVIEEHCVPFPFHIQSVEQDWEIEQRLEQLGFLQVGLPFNDGEANYYEAYMGALSQRKYTTLRSLSLMEKDTTEITKGQLFKGYRFGKPLLTVEGDTPMRVKVAKEFTFDAAHRLPFHDGKCKNLHGHTYLLTVMVEAEMADKNMVIDFGDLKQIVNKWIIDKFDHALIVGGEDNQNPKFQELIVQNNMAQKVVTMEAESTAENMAILFAHTIADALKTQRVTKPFNVTVRLHETPKSWAEVTV